MTAHDKLLAAEEQRLPKPNTIHLNLTEKCNIFCRICKPDDFSSYADSASLSKEVIDKVIAEAFDGLTQLRLDSAGELLLSPHLPYVLEEATKRNIPIFVSTNGVLLTEEKAEMLCASSLDSIQISVDSPDKETLEWIRRGADFDKVIKGAENLVKARARHGKTRPRIEFHAAIMQQNLHQLPDLVRLAKRIGIDGVGVAYCFIHQHMKPEWAVFWDKDESNRIIQESRELAKELGITFNAPIPFHAPLEIATSKHCQYLFEWSYIQPTGKVYPCCISAGDYECGDLNKTSFENVWYGERYQVLRETYNTATPVYYKCASCYIAAGWHPNDYKSHFNPAHWEYVEKRLAENPDEQETAYCTFGEHILRAEFAPMLKEVSTLLRQNRPVEAIPLMGKEVMAHPGNLALRLILAELMLDSKQPDRAVLVLQEVLEYWPDDIQAMNSLAQAHVDNGNYREGFETIKKILEKNPANHNAHKTLQKLKKAVDTTVQNRAGI